MGDTAIFTRYFSPYNAIKDNCKITVRKYLQIDHCADEEPYSILDLSIHSKNCLDLLFQKTGSVRDILELPLMHLLGMRSADTKTIQEILKAVKEYALRTPKWDDRELDSWGASTDISVTLPIQSLLRPYAEYISQEKWNDMQAKLNTDEGVAFLQQMRKIADVIGAEMVAAMLTSSYPITTLLPMLQNFIHVQKEEAMHQEEVSELLSEMPEKRRTLRVKPFVFAWPSEKKELLQDVFDETITFSELTKTASSLDTESYHALRSFLLWCQPDIQEKIEDVLERSINDERTAKIIRQRTDGKTLDEIGIPMNITRERVRQIEQKAVRSFQSAGAISLLQFLFAECGGRELLTSAELKKACGAYGGVLSFLWRSIDELRSFRYLKAQDAFILNGSDHLDNLNLTQESKEFIGFTLERLMADGEIHGSRELFSLACIDGSGWLDEIGIENHFEFFSVAAYLFEGEYVFSRPWIRPISETSERNLLPQKRNNRIIDAVIAVLQETAVPMTVKEITDAIVERELYVFRTSKPSDMVNKAILNALNGYRKRGPIPGYQIGRGQNESGRNVFYLMRSAPQEPLKSDAANQPERVPVVDVETANRMNSILSEEFPDGLRLNGMRLRKFRNLYQERFGAVLEPEDEKLTELLKQSCDFRDDRIYARPDERQSTLLTAMEEESLALLREGASGIFLQQLFARYKSQLASELSVYTPQALEHLLSGGNKAYVLRLGVLCLPGQNSDPASDVRRFFQTCYEPVTYDQLQQVLWYIPFECIQRVLVTEPFLAHVDSETYFYAPNFPISAQELDALRRAMYQSIQEEGYLVAKGLCGLMQTRCPNAWADAGNWKDWGIRNVMAKLLGDSFDFNKAVICAKGSGTDTHQIVRSYCKNRLKVTLEDLKVLCSRLGSSGIYWDSVVSEMVRISKTVFISKAEVHFDTEAVDRILNQACPGNQMPLREFALFMALPGIGYPWNGYLLESFIRDYSRIFRLVQARPTEHTYIGAMVRRSSPIRSEQELYTHVLADDDTWDTTEDALTILTERGYRAQRKKLANASEVIGAARARRQQRRESEK